MKEIKKYFPLILVELYLIISYLLYRYGCYKWTFGEDNRTFVFMLLVAFTFGIGYFFNIKRNRKDKEYNKFARIPCQRVLMVCCIISIIIFVPMCISYTDSWYPPVLKALTDPKGVYYALAEVGKNRNGIRIWGFLDVFPYMLLPIVLYKWEEVSTKLKSISLILAIGYLMIYISSARNISVAVQMLSVVAVWLGVIFGKQNEFYKKSVIRTSLLSFLYCVIVVSFFNLTISSRSGYTEQVAQKFEEAEMNTLESEKNTTGVTKKPFKDKFAEIAKDWDADAIGQHVGVGVYEYNGLKITEEQIEKFNQVYEIFPNYTDVWSKSYVDTNSGIMRYLPGSIKNLYISATGYITNGYNCLTIALRTDHVWTYGIGHSTFLTSYVDAFLGTDIASKTYYSRLTNDEVYPLVSKSFWPSTFVQLGDDLTFPGVILFMGIAGGVIAQIWLSIINKGNYWGVILLGEVELWALFLPANNVLEGSGSFFVSFWLTFIAWIVTQIPARKTSLKSEKCIVKDK